MVLREPHRPERRRARPARIADGGAADQVGRDPRDLRRQLRGVGAHRLADGVEVMRPRRDEGAVLEPLGEHMVQHRVQQGDIGPRDHLQVDVGAGRELDPPRVGDDELRPALQGPLDRRPEDRVALRGVRPEEEDHLGLLLYLAHRPRGRAGGQGALHRAHRGGVAETGAVINVVGAEPRAEELLEDVVLLVGALGALEDRERAAAMRVVEPAQLLGGEIERFLPGGFAEGGEPVWGCGDPVARVAESGVGIVACARERGADRFGAGVDPSEWIRARAVVLGLATLGSHRAPRSPAAAPTRVERRVDARVVVPLAGGVAHPPAADEWARQSVAVQREVGPESPFDAGRALVRRRFFYPWRRHPRDLIVADLEIELAPHRAVGADRAHLGGRRLHRPGAELRHREDVVDRPRRADPHALPAPGAPRMFRVPVRPHDDLRMLPPRRHLQHPDHLDLLARPHAAGAEDAGRHVVRDDRVRRAFVPRAERELPRARERHLVAVHQRLELVPPVIRRDLLDRVALQQHRQDRLAVLHCPLRFRRDDHPVGRRRRAGREEFVGAFDRDEADAAVAGRRELRIPAEGRDIDAECACGVEDRRALGGGAGPAVDREVRHRGECRARSEGSQLHSRAFIAPCARREFSVRSL